MQWRTQLKKVFDSLGVSISRAHTVRSIDYRRALIMNRSGIDLVFDVGANSGQYGAALRASGYSGRILSFEPLSRPYKELDKRTAKDERWACEKTALGSFCGRTSMNVSANSVSSSILSVDDVALRSEPLTMSIGMEEVPIAPLDTFSDRVRMGDKVMLKIDVQGYEDKVLEGAEELLALTVCLEIELSLVELYKGQILYREMLGRLESMGFGLFSVEPGFTDPHTGRVLQFDGILVRTDGRGS